jgi:uncharacterized protein
LDETFFRRFRRIIFLTILTKISGPIVQSGRTPRLQRGSRGSKSHSVHSNLAKFDHAALSLRSRGFFLHSVHLLSTLYLYSMAWIPTEKEAWELLKKENTSESVIKHCEAVTKLVKELIRDLPVNQKIIVAGAVLHDIGRSKTHGVQHGVAGAKILREKGVDEKVVRIVETHVGVGIPKEEAVKLGLSDGDLIPETIEEKIVCYADKRLIGTYVATEEEALYDFKKKLGENHPAIKRMKKFFEDVNRILESKNDTNRC